MKHRIHLGTAHRANDPDLIRLVSECFAGELSPDMLELGVSLSRDLPPEKHAQASHLYATNFECDIHNMQELSLIDSPQVVFVGEDEGEVKYLDSNSSPKKLALKVTV